MFKAVHRLDLDVFRRVALRRSPRAEVVLPRLSRAADHSKLWLGIAGVLWLSRSRTARRAALRGVGSLAGASLLVNGPVKWIARRQRPVIDDVPEVRRLRRLPRSGSFPSGHSASAFAFATALSIEKPVLAAGIVPLASMVAASRVYVGVHYPSDVIAGSVLGSLIAVGSRKVWPRVPDQPPDVKRLSDSTIKITPEGRGLTIAVNVGAGNGSSHADQLRKAFPDAEIVEVDPDGGDELRRVLEEHASRSEMIGVSGGDGSINCAAQVAVEAGMPLAVIPSGTLNHLARDLALESIDDGMEAIRNGACVAMDVATIDGQVFLNTASFGSYVDLVDARERFEESLEKWPAVLVALVRVLKKSEPIEIEIDGHPSRVWMAFIGNCRYQPSGFAPTWREDLADGLLDLRVIGADEPFARSRLVLSILTGRLGRSHIYRQTTVSSMRVRSQGQLRLARDGETFEASSNEFAIDKYPTRLAVLVLPEDQERFK